MDWISVFDKMSREMLPFPHQSSGWKDIGAVEEWDEYVFDVIGDRVPPRGSVFEAGCGCLAFLGAVRKRHPLISIAGCDASLECIERIQMELASSAEAERFYQGHLPDGLRCIPDEQYDVVVSNSVFQYLREKEDAIRSVEEMLRIARSGGTVIVADVCDEAEREKNEESMRRLWPSYGTPGGLPSHTYFAREWWQRFAGDRIALEVSSSGAPRYWRRKYRYNVYLVKSRRRSLPAKWGSAGSSR